MESDQSTVSVSDYREVLGCFSTGVVIATCSSPTGDIAGLTVNAFSAVSIDPPLILICPQKSSQTGKQIQEAGRFAINILQHDQKDLALRFARTDVDTRDVAWLAGEHGSPLLEDSLAFLECAVWEVYDGGDHDIIVGKVLALKRSEFEEPPLRFYQGELQ